MWRVYFVFSFSARNVKILLGRDAPVAPSCDVKIANQKSRIIFFNPAAGIEPGVDNHNNIVAVNESRLSNNFY